MQTRLGRPLVALFASLLLSGAPHLTAAQAGPPWPGDRVRVSDTNACWRSARVGRLVSLGPDSLVLSVGRGPSETRLTVPRRAVVCLERGQHAGTYAGRGMVLGVLAGVAAGAGAVAILAANACADCWGAVLLLPYTVGGGAVIGGGVGYLIGRSVPRVEWRRVPLPVRLGVAPGRRGDLVVRLTLR